MSEEQRMIIAKVVRSDTKNGKPVAELYGDNMRFEYPELQLFDLSQLLLVGIDPNTLQDGVEHWCRFYAWYVQSDKLNKNGNPYKDVVRLESIALPGPDEAVVDEIRDLHATVTQLSSYVQDLLYDLAGIHDTLKAGLLEDYAEPAREQLVEQPVEQPPVDLQQEAEPPQIEDEFPGELPEAEPPEMESPGAEPPRQVEPPQMLPHRQPPPADPPLVLDEDQSRRAFFQEAGPAINNKIITPADVKSWKAAVEARRISWRDALDQLRARVPEAAA
ncbi:MAG: hypothetical protein JW741_06090 [Sedimentisphaerales bacterium]|nr:hypothetical protein [Sedimentisphaerales bacterium]